MGEDKKAAVLGEEKSEPYTCIRLLENIGRSGVYGGELKMRVSVSRKQKYVKSQYWRNFSRIWAWCLCSTFSLRRDSS